MQNSSHWGETCRFAQSCRVRLRYSLERKLTGKKTNIGQMLAVLYWTFKEKLHDTLSLSLLPFEIKKKKLTILVSVKGHRKVMGWKCKMIPEHFSLKSSKPITSGIWWIPAMVIWNRYGMSIVILLLLCRQNIKIIK